MPSEKFPGPNYNRLIDEDPQIVKVNLDQVEWGSRKSLQAKLTGDAEAPGGAPAAPGAPGMTIRHVGKK